MSKNGWVEHEDGWYKEGEGRGNASFFGKPLPPMRDSHNRPLKWNGSDWIVDFAALIEEINNGIWVNGELRKKN